MSQMRFNPVTHHWVIISGDREERPYDFDAPEVKTQRHSGERRDDCPFCPGNEDFTTEELARVEDQAGNWLIRAVYNKFPALFSKPKLRRQTKGTFLSMEASGQHEVVIEHPRHDVQPASHTPEHLAQLLGVYRDRYAALRKMKHIENITLFRNHGQRAGTSLEHPHSQVIAAPIVPHQVRLRLQDAEQFHSKNGACLFCRVLEEELAAEERIVEESPHFAGFVPYAALSPYHQWIFPKRHCASFDDMTGEEIDDLARLLNRMMIRMRDGIGDPDFNLSVRSAPTALADSVFFHWYIALIPRVNRIAGFELGSGMHINPVAPEQAAAQLRAVDLI